jgi:hypothetical protein
MSQAAGSSEGTTASKKKLESDAETSRRSRRDIVDSLPYEPLTAAQMIECARRLGMTSNGFLVGVFMRDELDSLPEPTSAAGLAFAIVNLDASSGPGEL